LTIPHKKVIFGNKINHTMRYSIVILVFVLIAGLSSCKAKQDCEYNHTGVLEITNLDDKSSEVLLDGTKIFDLESQETNSLTVESGEHDIRCFIIGGGTEEVEGIVVLVDCETTEYDIVY
jgi:hypothetical protein